MDEDNTCEEQEEVPVEEERAKGSPIGPDKHLCGVGDSPQTVPAGGTPGHASDTPRYAFGETPIHQPGTPSHCPTPLRTPNHQDSENSSSEDEDRDPNVSYHNPEPTSEIQPDLMEADNIGNTVFSKHWLFTTLMSLIRVIDKHSESKDSPSREAGGIDIEDSLQDELCKLWDMSMNSEVVSFLLEFKAIDLFAGVIAESKAPRATEICVGILGNMACTEEAAVKIAENKKLVNLMLLLLNDHDAPTLVESTRLIHCSLSSEDARQAWVDAMREDNMVLANLLFILSSSTNGELLHNAAELVDKIMDVDETLCERWSTVELIRGVLEAAKQVKVHPCETLDSLLHVLQLASTTQTGVAALVEAAEPMSTLLLGYLIHMCSEEIVAVEGKENSFASAFSVLNVIFESWSEGSSLIIGEYQMLRCLIKVLDVVYRKLFRERLNMSRRRTYSRRRTASQSLDSPEQKEENKEENKDEDVKMEKDKKEEEEDRHSSMSESDSSSLTGEYDATMMKMLYEVLQGLAVDILLALEQYVTQTNGEAANTGRLPDCPPKSLIYMDSNCLRDRLYYFIYMLQDTELHVDSLLPESTSESTSNTPISKHLTETPKEPSTSQDASEVTECSSHDALQTTLQEVTSDPKSDSTSVKETPCDEISSTADSEKAQSSINNKESNQNHSNDISKPCVQTNSNHDASNNITHDFNSDKSPSVKPKRTYVDMLVTLAHECHLDRLSRIIDDVLDT